MYRIGDKVLVRQWSDMEKEFGLNKYGSINTYCHFVSDMSVFCGKVVTINKVFKESSGVIYEIKEDPSYFDWDDGMFVTPENSISYLLKGKGKNV